MKISRLVLSGLMMLVSALAMAKGSGVAGVRELPATAPGAQTPLVVFLSGDGGWAALDSGVSSQLRQRGYSVLGWNSLTYYWKKKSPEQVTSDLTTLLEHYLPLWKKEKVMLIGFSFGAEITPFAINRLKPELRQRIMGNVMLSPSTSSDFEIHVSEILSSSKQGHYLTEPEISRITDIPQLCFYGTQDDDPELLCPKLKQANVKNIPLAGGHHFEDDYPLLTKLILEGLALSPSSAKSK